jgi:hypothetical protein
MSYASTSRPWRTFLVHEISKENVFPLSQSRDTVPTVNKRLTETQIRDVCAELMGRNANLSGRELRRELLNRFGAVGKTERVFAVWREEAQKARPAAELQSLPTNIRELQKRLSVAEAAAAQNLARAELAEYRERAHQDHWAMEIDRVKRELEEARSSAADGQGRGSRSFPV